jgi:hypothetical protein
VSCAHVALAVLFFVCASASSLFVSTKKRALISTSLAFASYFGIVLSPFVSHLSHSPQFCIFEFSFPRDRDRHQARQQSQVFEASNSERIDSVVSFLYGASSL